MYLKSLLMIGWFVGSWVCLVFVASTPLTAIASAVSLGLAIAGIGMAVQHDANHGAYSRHATINKMFGATLDLMGVCSFIWRPKHNTFHHTFTNIVGVDYDLDFGVLARLSPEQPRRAWHRFQHLYLWALYGFLLPKWVFYDDFVILSRRMIGQHPLPEPDARAGELQQARQGRIHLNSWISAGERCAPCPGSCAACGEAAVASRDGR